MVREHIKDRPIKGVVRVIDKLPYHWHDELTVVKVLKGEVKVRIWARDNFLKKGDIMVFNIGEVHQVESITKDNFVLILFINKEYCEEIINGFDRFIIFCNSHKYEHMHPLKYKQFRKYLNELILAVINYSLDSSYAIDKYVEKFLEYATTEFDYVTCGVDLKKFSRKVIKRNRQLYREYLLANGQNRKLSLKQVADAMGISYSHLRKDIIERYGHGYKWLQFTVMVENAVRMIVMTNHPITYIGEYCGFSDPKYMIKYFKIFFNCTPSEFRILYKDNYESYKFIELPLTYFVE